MKSTQRRINQRACNSDVAPLMPAAAVAAHCDELSALNTVEIVAMNVWPRRINRWDEPFGHETQS